MTLEVVLEQLRAAWGGAHFAGAELRRLGLEEHAAQLDAAASLIAGVAQDVKGRAATVSVLEAFPGSRVTGSEPR